jgi:tetratricopeptide (TPR) repeat protein
MKNKRLVIKAIVIFGIICAMPIIGLAIDQKQVGENKPGAIVVVGSPKNNTAGLQKELAEAARFKSFLDKGNELVRQGQLNDGIKQYEMAFSVAKISGARGLAILAMADAYEANRDYKNALAKMVIIRDKYVNEWAKAPDVERVIYLEYAINGDYNLAIEHAQKALEAEAKLPNVPKGGSPDYIQRLNDLKAAKDHILSLKAKE